MKITTLTTLLLNLSPGIMVASSLSLVSHSPFHRRNYCINNWSRHHQKLISFCYFNHYQQKDSHLLFMSDGIQNDDNGVINNNYEEIVTTNNTEDEATMQFKKIRRRKKNSVVISTSSSPSSSSLKETDLFGPIYDDDDDEIFAEAWATVDNNSNEFANRENDGNNAEQTTTSAQSPTKCPLFSMTFPRYRINLSNTKGNPLKDPESEQRRLRRVARGTLTKLTKTASSSSENISGVQGISSKGRNNGTKNNTMTREGEKKQKSNNPFNFMSGLFNSKSPNVVLPSRSTGDDSKLYKSTEALYQEEIVRNGAMFRWASSSSTLLEESSSSSSSSGLLLADEDFVAAAAFWRMAADLSQKARGMAQQQCYLALPETTTSIAQNLCDILNWYADLLGASNDDNGDAASMTIRANLDARSNNGIPVIQFTATTTQQHKGNNDNNKQWQQQQEQYRMQLPSASDTERQTKAWVKRVLVGLGICPFTKSDVKSGQGLGDMGVPVANIMYRHSAALCVVGDKDVYLLLAGECATAGSYSTIYLAIILHSLPTRLVFFRGLHDTMRLLNVYFLSVFTTALIFHPCTRYMEGDI